MEALSVCPVIAPMYLPFLKFKTKQNISDTDYRERGLYKCLPLIKGLQHSGKFPPTPCCPPPHLPEGTWSHFKDGNQGDSPCPSNISPSRAFGSVLVTTFSTADSWLTKAFLSHLRSLKAAEWRCVQGHSSKECCATLSLSSLCFSLPIHPHHL